MSKATVHRCCCVPTILLQSVFFRGALPKAQAHKKPRPSLAALDPGKHEPTYVHVITKKRDIIRKQLGAIFLGRPGLLSSAPLATALAPSGQPTPSIDVAMLETKSCSLCLCQFYSPEQIPVSCRDFA